MTRRQRPDFRIKTGSTDPVYRATIETRTSQDSIGRSPVDLTDIEDIEFILQVDDEGLLYEPVDVLDAEAGEVEVRLPSGIGSGTYDAEFRADFADGETLFWPQHRNIIISVAAGIERELDPADLSDPDASVTTLNVDRLSANEEDYIGVDDPIGDDADKVPSADVETLNTEDLDTDFAYQVRDDESLQDAIDRAESDGIGTVKAPAGSYDAADLPTALNLTGGGGTSTFESPGASIDNRGGAEPAVISDGQNVIRSFEIRGDATVDANETAVRITSSRGRIEYCRIRDGELLIESSQCTVFACDLDGNDIRIDADDCTIIGNTGVGTIHDEGSGNEVVGNT